MSRNDPPHTLVEDQGSHLDHLLRKNIQNLIMMTNNMLSAHMKFITTHSLAMLSAHIKIKTTQYLAMMPVKMQLKIIATKKLNIKNFEVDNAQKAFQIKDSLIF